MTLGWYARRLAGMSGPEVLHRLREATRRAASRRRSHGWAAFPAPGPPRPLPGLAGRLREGATPALREAIRAAARDLLAGRFAALGVAWPGRSPENLFPPDLWRLDPVSGLAWPGADRFAFDVPYRHVPGFCDVKYIWEINRLQFLQPLALAVALDGDARALAAIEDAVASWAGANPPFRGLAWNSGIETALRAVSLAVAATLCGDRLAAATRERIAAILAASAHWLARFPSLHSSANNHRVAEALGLLVIASTLPELADAGAVAREAGAVLEAEALRQILPDGMGAEQSPTYAAFTAELILVGRLVAAAAGRPLPAAVDARLGRFAEAVSWLAGPDGTVPAIGDDDGGRVLTLGGPERTYPVSVARLAAGAVGRTAHLPRGTDPPAWREILALGPRPAPPPLGLRSFEAGGVTVVRERRAGRDLHLVLDHGPLGYLAIAAHGHADANALLLALDGVPILVDPGTYLYHAGGAWRRWLRGTRAHNTLALGDEDQSRIAGPFNWSRKAVARLDSAEPGADWRIAASHDGYRRRLGAIHHRTVVATPDGFAVVDRLLGRGHFPAAEVAFQFAPDLEIALAGAGCLVRSRGAPVLRLAFSAPGALTLARGEPGMAGGWVSPAFGTILPAPRLVWRGRVPESGLRTDFFLPTDAAPG